MYYTKLPRSIHITDVDYHLSNSGCTREGLKGWASFVMNNFLIFKNIPIHVADGCVRFDFSNLENGSHSGVTSLLSHEDFLREVENQVGEKILEVVG